MGLASYIYYFDKGTEKAHIFFHHSFCFRHPLLCLSQTSCHEIDIANFLQMNHISEFQYIVAVSVRFEFRSDTFLFLLFGVLAVPWNQCKISILKFQWIIFFTIKWRVICLIASFCTWHWVKWHISLIIQPLLLSLPVITYVFYLHAVYSVIVVLRAD